MSWSRRRCANEAVSPWTADTAMSGLWSEQGEKLRKLMPETFILAPGYGAQGASAADLAAFFDEEGSGAIVNSSRGIIAAWQKEPYRQYGPEGFAQAARAAALDMIEDLRQAIANR